MDIEWLIQPFSYDKQILILLIIIILTKINIFKKEKKIVTYKVTK